MVKKKEKAKAKLPIIRTRNESEIQIMKIISWSVIIGHPNLFIKKGTRPACTECGCSGLLHSKKVDGKFKKLCSMCYSELIGEIPEEVPYFEYNYPIINKLITDFGFAAIEKSFYLIYRARWVFENDDHAFRSLYTKAKGLSSGY